MLRLVTCAASKQGVCYVPDQSQGSNVKILKSLNCNFERNVLCTHKQLRFWKCSPQSRSRYEWRQCHWSELVPRHNILYLVTDQLLCREQRRSLSENTVLDDWHSINREMEIITTCILQHPYFSCHKQQVRLLESSKLTVCTYGFSMVHVVTKKAFFPWEPCIMR